MEYVIMVAGIVWLVYIAWLTRGCDCEQCVKTNNEGEHNG